MRLRFNKASAFDLKEPFSSQIITPTRHRRKRVPTPKWMYNDVEVRAFLLKLFPRLESNEEQHRRAGRWAYIIRHYFCSNESASEIGSERGLTTKAVQRIVHRIRLVIAGRRQDGKPRTGRSRGRPRKMLGYIQTL